MSDYASFVTEPMWERDNGLAVEYFRKAEWTGIRGERNSIAFAGILRDLSPAGLHCQARNIVAELADILPADADLRLVLLEEGNKLPAVVFSVREYRGDTTECKERMERERLRNIAIRERQARDEIEMQGLINQELNEFLAKSRED